MKERPISYKPDMVRARNAGDKFMTRRALKVQPPVGFLASNGGQTSCTHYRRLSKQSNDWLERDGFGWDLGRCDDSQRFWPGMTETLFCPYGDPGDRLWVREAWRTQARLDGSPPRDLDPSHQIWYEADAPKQPGAGKFRPPMFMPRWASRGLDEITSVRAERLQDISEADCIAEGAPGGHGAIADYSYNATPHEHYRHIWQTINGPGSWAANPWVWVIEFKVLQK